MADLFTNPMTAFKEGYTGATSVIEDVASGADIKQATEQVKAQTPTIDESGAPVETLPVDMFKVNSLASQMAASRGDTRSADKFQKQAQEYKKESLVIANKELDLQQAKLEKAEQDLQLMTDPKVAMEQLLKADLPTDQKLRMATMLREVGDDPEKFKAFKANIQNSVMTAKDRLTAEQRTLKMKQDHEDRLEQRKIQLERVRTDAILREGMLELRRDQFAFQQDKFESEFGLKGAKTVADVESKTRALIAKVAKDPLLSKEERKAEIERISQGAERTISRIESAGKGRRGGKDIAGDRDSSSTSGNIPQEAIDMLIADPSLEAAFNEKFKTKDMATPAKEFLERAKQENKTPSNYKTTSEKVTEAELNSVMKQRKTFFTGPVDYKEVSEDTRYSKAIRAAALAKYKQMMRED